MLKAIALFVILSLSIHAQQLKIGASTGVNGGGFTSDPSYNGAWYPQGYTSGGLGFSVADIAGTATTLIWPADTGAATTGYTLSLGAVAACPAHIPTTIPATCRYLTWAAAGAASPVTPLYTGSGYSAVTCNGSSQTLDTYTPANATFAVDDIIQIDFAITKTGTAGTGAQGVTVGNSGLWPTGLTASTSTQTLYYQSIQTVFSSTAIAVVGGGVYVTGGAGGYAGPPYAGQPNSSAISGSIPIVLKTTCTSPDTTLITKFNVTRIRRQ